MKSEEVEVERKLKIGKERERDRERDRERERERQTEEVSTRQRNVLKTTLFLFASIIDLLHREQELLKTLLRTHPLLHGEQDFGNHWKRCC